MTLLSYLTMIDFDGMGHIYKQRFYVCWSDAHSMKDDRLYCLSVTVAGIVVLYHQSAKVRVFKVNIDVAEALPY